MKRAKPVKPAKPAKPATGRRAVTSRPVSRAGHPPVARSATLAQATSARQQAEAALQRSERRYRELVEHSLGLICAHDVDGHLLFVNPAAARSLGYAPDDWVGRNLRDFVPAEAHLLYEDYLRRKIGRAHV